MYLAEIATPGHKGFYVSWQSASQQVAIIVAAALGYALQAGMAPSTLAAWGWRIPFYAGCLIVPVIFVIRRSLQETPAFLAQRHRPTMREILRSLVEHSFVVAGGTLLVVMTTVSFYLIARLDNRAAPALWMSFSAMCGLAGTLMLLSRRRGYGASSRSGRSATT